MIYILYGEMGCGKTYLGNELAGFLGCNFLEGDDILPYDLGEKVKKVQSLTTKEVERFVKRNLIPVIETYLYAGDLVVSQALYRKDHRKMISDHFRAEQIVWINVVAPFFSHMKRLLGRENGKRWAMLALMSKPFFQTDKLSLRINNIDNIDLKQKFKDLLCCTSWLN